MEWRGGPCREVEARGGEDHAGKGRGREGRTMEVGGEKGIGKGSQGEWKRNGSGMVGGGEGGGGTMWEDVYTRERRCAVGKFLSKIN
jgi:hypothetical protein